MTQPAPTRKVADMLAARLMPQRFLASQLRRPTGRFGRWVMTRALNNGNAELITAAIDSLGLQRDEAFLDLGFGGGLALELAAARTEGPLWGVDFSGDVVLAGMRRFDVWITSGRLNLITADVVKLPLRDGLVNAICTTNTIYFWPDLDAAFRSLLRVLAPGGRLAVGYSGADKMKRFDRITQHGFRLFEPEQVEQLLRGCGFGQVQTIAQTGPVSHGDFVSTAVV